MASIARETAHSSEGFSPTLAEYSREYFEWDTCRRAARQRAKKRPFTKAVAVHRRGHLINYLFTKFRSRKLRDITAVEIEDWLATLRLANQTRNHILYSLSIAMREAKRNGLIDKNTAEDVSPWERTSGPLRH